MKRLTKLVDGEFKENHDNDDWEKGKKGWRNGSRACMNKLGAYEDTGLEPQEIEEILKLLNSLSISDVVNIATARKEAAKAQRLKDEELYNYKYEGVNYEK